MLAVTFAALSLLIQGSPTTISVACPTPEQSFHRWQSPTLSLTSGWNEAIVSVNLRGGPGTVHVEACWIGIEGSSNWFDLGTFSNAPLQASSSVKGQISKSKLFSVATDTFHSGLTACLGLRIQTSSLDCVVSRIYVCASDARQLLVDAPVATRALYIEPLKVPELCQGDYPNGSVLCSPTALAMVLNYYADKFHRPEYRLSVPQVSRGVWDKAYDGAGNWSFNVAFAGSLPGLRAYVVRYGSLQELEKKVTEGVPVVCSVSRLLLNGKPLTREEKGHLVVVRGFTEAGDVLVNDPGKRRVARAYPRSDFLKAWNYSHGTCYIVERD